MSTCDPCREDVLRGRSQRAQARVVWAEWGASHETHVLYTHTEGYGELHQRRETEGGLPEREVSDLNTE